MKPNDRWQDILSETARQQSFMEQLCATVTAAYRQQGGKIFCEKGCSSCCTLAVNCTAAEALLVAGALDKAQKSSLNGYIEQLRELAGGISEFREYLRLYRRDLGGCPFLVGSSCGIYAARPISCRALLATRESFWCGVDFGSLDAAEKQLFIESLDRTVTAFPLHYLAATRDAGQNLEAQASLQMLKEFGFSLYGSMPLLVYLFTECALLESIEAGADAVLRSAAASGFDNPFFLQIEKL